MEEDVEIELLYKEHGDVLMEAAAVDYSEDEVEKSGDSGKSSGEEQVISVEKTPNVTVAGKKHFKGGRRKKMSSARNQCKIKEMFIDDSSSDADALLDDSILKCVMSRGAKSNQDLDSEINNCFVENNESESCINEILDNDESLFREKSPELVETQVGNESSIDDDDRDIMELISFQNMIDKRDEVLEKIERKLKERLIEVINTERQDREAVDNLLQRETQKLTEPNFFKCFYKKFGIPYFQDSFDFPAPTNEDFKQKNKNGELIILRFTKLKYWKKLQKDKLQDAVQLTLVEENSNKLVSEINKLKDMLKSVSDEHTEKDILSKILQCQKKLNRIKNMSYVELVACENPDRQYDWLKYAASDLNLVHSAEECKRFWHLYLKPTINKSCWERSENEKLLEIAEQMNFQDWKSIAQSLGTNRSAYQCLIQYRNRLCDKHDFSTGKWTKEEDDKLLSVINSSKVGNFIPWSKVASYIGDRNHLQIYNRYMNCLNPKLIKGRFSKEEDLLIVSGIEVFGVTYKEMASLINNRTTNQIRERYERHLLPKTRKTGLFSLEEDEKVLKLVDKYGEKNFCKIADEMKTRTRTQIRQRYNFIKQMMKSKPGWTPAQAKRRRTNKVYKQITQTQRNVEKLKTEMEHIVKTLKLSKLESDTFRIEKLKELRDIIFTKKYDVKKYKKKTYSDNSELNKQLLEYFKYHHINKPTKPLTPQKSKDNSAYLNEMLLLAKYFGYDLQLPKSKDEIRNNKNLNPSLQRFLIETLEQPAAVDATCDRENVEEPLENAASAEEPHNNVDYVEPEADDTLIMEECWHNTTVNLSNLNFSEFFKRTVFDYSNGMHQDIWDSKVNRSKSTVVNDVINNANPSNGQKYFLPPNSVTTVGYKSLLLSRTRLKCDSKKLEPEKGFKSEKTGANKTEGFKNVYHFGDKFQETLLSLFYCPRVLSLTDIASTSLPPSALPRARIKPARSKSIIKNESFAHIFKSSNENTSDIVRKVVAQPIENSAKQEKKIQRNILQVQNTCKRQQKEFQSGITCNRKMSIEHLVKNVKIPSSTITSSQVKKINDIKQKSKESYTELNGEKSKKVAVTSKTNLSKNKTDSPNTKLDSEDFTHSFNLKLPNQAYTRTRQSLKRHLDSSVCSEPATKKSYTNCNVQTSLETNNVCPESHSTTTVDTE